MKIYEICFSPTGGTEKVAGFIAAKLGSDIVNIDLTDRKADFKGIVLNGDDVAVIAVPSYGGRVPAPAVERITQISGSRTHNADQRQRRKGRNSMRIRQPCL